MNVQRNEVGPQLRGLESSLVFAPRRGPMPSNRPLDRVVTIASLSRRIAGRYICETLARALHSETGGSVLLIDLEMADGRVPLSDWARVQQQLNGAFAFQSHLQEEGGLMRLRLGLSDNPEE